ncbi:hypothetical protein [Spiroplasma endosymbiont of Diplazon laetatorius]|uniref:hypothetical protein n=1 Tax=Spiroplasma endosymbiont of Diplazon laetatorius TaxID=3066322 RepID=UPI0030D01A90
MKRKFIKLDENGNEIKNEDGTFEFEELEFPDGNVETEKNASIVPEPEKINSEEIVKQATEQVLKTLNISEPIPNIETKPKEYEDSIVSNTGFNPAQMKKVGN